MKIPTTLTATLLLSTLALAQNPPSTDADPPQAKATFEALDRNSDQRLSKTEADADDTISSQFANLDANSDGYLNRNEYSHVTAPMPPRTRQPMPDPSDRDDPEDPGA